MAYSDLITADAPVAYWPLDQPSGTQTDVVSGNNFTVSSAYTSTTENVSLAGVPTSTASIGLTNAWMTPANSAPFNMLGSFTLEAWVKKTSTAATVLFSKNLGYEVSFANDRSISIGGASTTFYGRIPSCLNIWTHVVFTVEENVSAVLYVNGFAVAEIPYSLFYPSAPTYDGNPFRLGGYSSGATSNRWVGNIAHVAIYYDVLTIQRVKARYFEAVGVPAAPQILFSETDGGVEKVYISPGWEGASAITGYEYSVDGGAYSSATITSEYVLTIASPPSDGALLRVRAINASGTSSVSNTIEVGTSYTDNVVAEGPLLYFPLCETSGTVAHDASPRGEGLYKSPDNGTFSGNVTYDNVGPFTCLGSSNSIYLDSAGLTSSTIAHFAKDFIAEGTTFQYTLSNAKTYGDFTVGVWFKPDADWLSYTIPTLGAQTESVVFQTYDTSASAGVVRLRAIFGNGVGSKLVLTGNSGTLITADERKIVAEQWNFILVKSSTTDGQTSLFVNGEKIGYTTTVINGFWGQSISVGAAYSAVRALQPAGALTSTLANVRAAAALKGHVAHFMFFEKALTNTKIRNLYRVGLCLTDRPDAPTVTSFIGDTITFTPPVDTGTSPITDYSYSIDGRDFVSIGGTTSPANISLGGGGSTLRLIATNASGDSIPSEPATIVVDVDSTIPMLNDNGWAAQADVIDSTIPTSASNGWTQQADLSDSTIPVSGFNGWTVYEPAGVPADSTIPTLNFNGWSLSNRIVSFSPTFGSEAGGTVVTFIGAFLEEVQTVTFDGAPGAITFQNSSTVIVTAPAGSGVATIEASTASGSVLFSCPDQFTYYSKPVITLVNPAYGDPAGGTLVYLGGSGFTDVVQVTFGGVEGTDITIIDDNTLSVVSPPNPAGPVHIVASSLADSSDETSADIFTYAANILPTAAFTATPSSGVAYLSVLFDPSLSSDGDGTIVAWDWDFDDGDTSTTQVPTHVFLAAGTYNVSLVVTDNQGGVSAPYTLPIVVSANTPPTAVAAATSATTGAAPLTVTFSGAGSSDPDGQTLSYLWDFDDGGATANTSSSFHTFSTPGTYEVTLTVSDTGGGSDVSDTITITVTENNPPTAVAVATTPTTGLASFFVSFSAAASSDPDGQPLSYLWDFGDGGTATSSAPTHLYTTPGTYFAKVRVTDPGGLWDESDEIEITVGVNTPPVAVAFADVTSGEAILVVTFDGGSSTDTEGDIIQYLWDFDDGRQAGGTVVSHAFYTAGVYNVTLTVTDENFATDTATVTVTVTENMSNLPPVAIMSASPASGPAPLIVQFDGSASYDDTGIYRGEWDFGDGTTSGYSNPRHTYVTPGEYLVTLTVTDIHGATGVATTAITVTETTLQPPDIWRISPSFGPTTGGNSIEIIGESLAAVTNFYFKNVNTNEVFDGDVETMRIISDGRITIFAPEGHGVCDIILENIAGESATGPQTEYTYYTPPTAVITGPTSGTPLEVLTWSAAASSSPFGIRSFYWTFGDGTLLEFGDADSSIEITSSHFYYRVGDYLLTLTVTDERGVTATATQSISISWPPGGPGGPTFPPDEPGWPWGPLDPYDPPSGGGWPQEPGGTIPPPMWLNSTCEAYSTRLQIATPQTYRESWIVNHYVNDVEFIVRVTVLEEIEAGGGFYLGALSMSGDGAIPYPPPTRSTAEFGYGENLRILTSTVPITRERVDGLWRVKKTGGVFTAGDYFSLSIRVPKTYEIVYASGGFINIFGRTVTDRIYCYLKSDCDLKENIIPLRKLQHDFWSVRKVGAKMWHGNLRKVGGPP